MNITVISQKASRIRIICSVFVYRFLLDIIYVRFIAPRYGYTGFSYQFSLKCFIVSVMITLLFAIYIAETADCCNYCDITINFLIYVYLIPQGTLCSYCHNDLSFYSYVIFFFILLIFINKSISIPPIRHGTNYDNHCFDIIVIVLGLLMIAMSGFYTDFRISFDLGEYHDYRIEAREYSIPSFLTYSFHWAKNILPIGTLYALSKKRRVLMVFTTICQVLCFSFNGKKSVLFTMILVFLLFFAYNDIFYQYISLAFPGLTTLAIIEIIIRRRESFITTKFIRRMMLVPSLLGWQYFDFFSNNEKLYLRSSILRFFGFESPYSDGVGRMIGMVYSGSDGSLNANTGLCGDYFQILDIILYLYIRSLSFYFLKSYQIV